MALGTSTPLIPRSPIRYPDVDMSGLNLGGGGSSEIVELSPSPSTATPARVSDDTLYVAVGKEVKESEYTIAWALHNSGGKKLCILHVHTPAQKIPMSNFSNFYFLLFGIFINILYFFHLCCQFIVKLGTVLLVNLI